MAKYYAVKNGRKIGIFSTWKECSEYVDGFSGAEYKAFARKSEAEEFLGIEKHKKYEPPVPNTRIGAPLPEPFETDADAAFYVDGSFNVKTGEYAFGAVLLQKDELFTFSHKYSDPDAASMRNVAGEIAGALFAMRYAVKYSIASIEIFYDYEGIEKWALGKWKANLEKTREYAAICRILAEKVDIKFTKVRGHSGDFYNDLADRLAKNELGIK